MEATSLESEVELGTWNVSEELARQYLEAVGDQCREYFDHSLVPPLALSAYALGALLRKLNLPPGAIHSLQEVETLRPVKFEESITGVAGIERPRRRGNLEFTTVSYALTDLTGQRVQTGKSTVLVTGTGAL